MSAPLESEKLRFANPTIPFLRAQDIQCIIDDLQMLNSGGGGGSGTVTSVGLSLPSLFNVTVSPVTTSGSLTAVLNTQAANTFFAGPSSGSATAPTFRVLTSTDIPSLSSVYVPYTGATGTVDLNNKTLTDIQTLGVGVVSVPNFITATGIQPASIGTTPGTSSQTIGNISLTAAQGGNTTIATTGVGGQGASIYIYAPLGGTASSATTSSTVGQSGNITITGLAIVPNTTITSTLTKGGQSGLISIFTANGGSASRSTGTNTGGEAGYLSLTGGSGGDAGTNIAGSGGVTAHGGDGAIINIQSGGGGSAQHCSGTGTGGLGGDINILAADGGGAYPAGSGNGGNGGNIYITAGNGGGGNTTNGVDGSIFITTPGSIQGAQISILNGEIQSGGGQAIYFNDQTVLVNNATTILGAGFGVYIPQDGLFLGAIGSGISGSVNFFNAANSYMTTFGASNSTGDQTYLLPTAMPAGNGYILSCNLAGQLSWVAH
jgi:hypothetical protein